MDDNAPKENPPPDFNKLDLSQLQGFSFGTQWTQEKPSSPERRERDSGDRPPRDGGGPDRRDRRTFRRPAAPAGGEGGAGAPAGGGGGGGYERREFSGDRRGGPRREGGDFRGGPRRDGPGGGGQRYGYGGRPQERGPYESPVYNATFYPEDTSFNTLVQTIRKSCRTVELFEIARTVVAKTDRFVVVLTHKTSAPEPAAARPASAPAATTGTAPATPAPAAPPKERKMFHISVPDGMPFESDDGAVAHVLSKHLDKFFDTADVEVEPPKGNFQVINKCGVTGELLGPPNYHRYNQIVQQHYTARLASRMSLEAFRTRIETLRDPEAVNQWLAKMKKATRYTWKLGRAAEPTRGTDTAEKPAAPAATPEPETPAAPAEPPAEVPAEPVATAEAAPNVEPAANAEAAPAAETVPAAPAEGDAPAAPTRPTFDTLEDARIYLLTQARDKVVRTAESARFHGKIAEQLPPGEIRRAVEGALERQQRFPLDTANALRGRLRREHFTIFKKGSKGVSYVCAVKRKFRIPGQTFADSIGTLISYIEANPMLRASELPARLLGITLPIMPPKPIEAAASAPATPAADAPAAAPAPAAEPIAHLSIDDRARIARMQGDLMWLVREGYVTEFIDGRLFAPPPMVEARKKEVEAEEHDPENFPDVPASSESTAATPAAPAPENPPVEPAPAAETPAAPPSPEEPAPAAPASEAAPAVEPAPQAAPNPDTP